MLYTYRGQYVKHLREMSSCSVRNVGEDNTKTFEQSRETKGAVGKVDSILVGAGELYMYILHNTPIFIT